MLGFKVKRLGLGEGLGNAVPDDAMLVVIADLGDDLVHDITQALWSEAAGIYEDDLDDLASYESLRLLGILGLLADGDGQPVLDQSRQVVLERMMGNAGQTNYAASKAGIIGFTKSLAKELGPRNITVNAVAPGVIETEMSQAVREMAGDIVKSKILMRRIGQPQEVAHAVWFLASRYASYITGQVISVCGGRHLTGT